jgi:hypothetical protein
VNELQIKKSPKISNLKIPKKIEVNLLQYELTRAALNDLLDDSSIDDLLQYFPEKVRSVLADCISSGLIKHIEVSIVLDEKEQTHLLAKINFYSVPNLPSDLKLLVDKLDSLINISKKPDGTKEGPYSARIDLPKDVKAKISNYKMVKKWSF